MSTLLVYPSLSDGNTFLTVAYDNSIKLWNANTGSREKRCLTPLRLLFPFSLFHVILSIMTITQTVEIPADRRITVPREVPTGKTVIAFTPMADTESITEKLNTYYKNHNSRLDDDLKSASYRLLTDVDW